MTVAVGFNPRNSDSMPPRVADLHQNAPLIRPARSTVRGLNPAATIGRRSATGLNNQSK